jgi:predicted Fe-S protein YdhL (DUF1289 family)
MAGIHITDIEAAINYWRDKAPSIDGITLSAEIRALAEVYALMVFYHEEEADEATFPARALAAWRTWYDTMPDTPCIAICSTSQGDAVCKGCGRTFAEVQHWTDMNPAEKRHTWRRITQENTAWRFNRYAERAMGAPTLAVARAALNGPASEAQALRPVQACAGRLEAAGLSPTGAELARGGPSLRSLGQPGQGAPA